MKRKSTFVDAEEVHRPATRSFRRYQEQQRLREATSFWRFPREIRDMIYAFTFSTDSTRAPPQPLLPMTPAKVEAIHNNYRRIEALELTIRGLESSSHQTTAKQSILAMRRADLRVARQLVKDHPDRLLNTTFLRTNKQIFAEANEFIHKRCVIGFQIRNLPASKWDCRQEKELLEARHIYISVRLHHQHNPFESPWTGELKARVGARRDIKTFEFRGHGHCVLWNANPDVEEGYVPQSFAWCDDNLHSQIMSFLGDLPKVKVQRSLKVSWEGDERFKENVRNRKAKEYFELIKKVKGRGGR